MPPFSLHPFLPPTVGGRRLLVPTSIRSGPMKDKGGGASAGGGGGQAPGAATTTKRSKKNKGKLYTLTITPLPQPKFNAIVSYVLLGWGRVGLFC